MQNKITALFLFLSINLHASYFTGTPAASSGGGGTWGSITGTLSSQTDLQTALDAKAANQTVVSVASNVTLTSNARHQVNTSSARSLTLPAVASSKCVELKDITGSAESNNITIVRDASNKIENISASYVYQTAYGSLRLCPDGTDWWVQ